MYKDGCLQKPRPRRVRKSTKQRKLELKERRERKRRLSEEEPSEERIDGYVFTFLRYHSNNWIKCHNCIVSLVHITSIYMYHSRTT